MCLLGRNHNWIARRALEALFETTDAQPTVIQSRFAQEIYEARRRGGFPMAAAPIPAAQAEKMMKKQMALWQVHRPAEPVSIPDDDPPTDAARAKGLAKLNAVKKRHLVIGSHADGSREPPADQQGKRSASPPSTRPKAGQK